MTDTRIVTFRVKPADHPAAVKYSNVVVPLLDKTDQVDGEHLQKVLHIAADLWGAGIAAVRTIGGVRYEWRIMPDADWTELHIPKQPDDSWSEQFAGATVQEFLERNGHEQVVNSQSALYERLKAHRLID